MKRVIPSIMMLFVVLMSTVTAAPREMSIQVNQTQLRSLPAYYGSVVATVNYGERMTILETKGVWARAAKPGNKAAGWIHLSALTEKRLVPKSGNRNAPASVSGGELSLAEKGFTEEVEKNYRQKNKEIDFTWVDNMEKIIVSPQESMAFLKTGQVRPGEGGTP